MTEVTYTTWARLEPRLSDPSLAPGVRAAVEDPLWLLGRQWQLGERDGEDTGSPVGLDVYGGWAPVTRLLHGAASNRNRSRAADYDAAAAPLEALVAREPAPGRGALISFALDVAARVAAEVDATALDVLRNEHPFDPARLAEALEACGPAGRERTEMLAARLFDGAALAKGGATPGLSAAARDAVGTVVKEVAAEVDVAALEQAQPAAYTPERLGTDFAVGALADGGEVVLRADDWDGEPLDWHAFDRSAETALGATGAITPLTLSKLPGRLGFRGAPAVRYWELEDRAVDLVSVTARPHEAALMAVLQFAFVYGGDWSSVPIEVPACSWLTISSIVVCDSFGGRTLVRHGGRDADRTQLWTHTGDTTGSLLVAPRTGPTLEGEPVEETMLLRDEQANLAWAIELIAPDGTGRPVPWSALAPPPDPPPDSSAELPPDRPTLRYRLATSVPEHWFPLVPQAAGDRLASYRVGVLPGTDGAPPVLPRGVLLQELAATGLAEQEVPRSGRRLLRRPHLTRSADGATHAWTARRAGAGRGEGASGLLFDVAEP